MKHKHAEVLHAFVDGVECEGWLEYSEKWFLITTFKDFDTFEKVRIKPEIPPDMKLTYSVEFCRREGMLLFGRFNLNFQNVTFVIDGVTGKIKDAEVIK